MPEIYLRFSPKQKKLASENMLYAENCADNATPTFSFHWILQLYTSLIIPDKDKYICFAYNE
jgi:hypothetical protein